MMRHLVKTVLSVPLLFALILTSFCSTAQAQTLGINLPSLAYPQGAQIPKAEAVRYYGAKLSGGEARIAISWKIMQPRGPGTALDPNEVQRLRTTLAMVRAAGLRPIVGFHDYGRFGDTIVGDGAITADQARVYFQLVMRAVDAPDIVYEPNEPHDMSDGAYVAYVQAFISAVRMTRWTAEIIIPGPNWSNRASFRDDHAWQLVSRMIDDYGARFSIQDHVYFDQWSAGQTTSLDPTALTDVRNEITRARALRLKLSFTETGVGQDAASLAVFRDFMALCRANADVVVRVTYWDGGGWSSGPFNLDPNNFWATPVVDKPQMAALLPPTR